MTEAQARLERQRIDCDVASRKYQRAVEAYRHGTKTIIAEARDKISRLKFEKDEAAKICAKERVYLAEREAEVKRGYQQ